MPHPVSIVFVREYHIIELLIFASAPGSGFVNFINGRHVLISVRRIGWHEEKDRGQTSGEIFKDADVNT